MIVVRVELHSAITNKVTEIGRMVIVNDGTGDHHTGNYYGKAIMGKSDHNFSREEIVRAPITRVGKVTGYKRQSLHVFNLVARMLASMRYK